MDTIPYFSGERIRDLITMEEVIEVMKTGFQALSRGDARVPLRMSVEMEADNGLVLCMPSYLPTIGRFCVKTVTQNWDNPRRNLPLVHAMLTIFDSTTGEPLANMDGETVTALRTGAGSGLATSLLARKDARIVALFGPGTQGETQLEAVCAVREIQRIHVFTRPGGNAEKLKHFTHRMGKKLGVEVTPAKDLELLKETDIICTATPSTTPLFEDKMLKEGCHINAVGGFRPEMVEIPSQTISRARVVVDQLESCLAEAGDLLQAMRRGVFSLDRIHGEIGQLVSGTLDARTDYRQITVFKSVGNAIQDLVTADLVLKKAMVSAHTNNKNKKSAPFIDSTSQ